MAETQAPKKIRPRKLGDYLEVMSKAVFQSGMSWKVVESKWPDIQEAFKKFDIDKVANMKTRDVDRLVKDRRVIRNRKKLEAIVGNAREIQELDTEHGTFRKYLRSHGDFLPTVKALRKRFKFIGDMGAYYFLYVVGEKVPPHEECVKTLGKG